MSEMPGSQILTAAGVQDDLLAVVAPPGAQLRLAVRRPGSAGCPCRRSRPARSAAAPGRSGRSRPAPSAAAGPAARPARPARAARRRGGSRRPSPRTAARPGCRRARTRRSGTASRTRHRNASMSNPPSSPGRTDWASAGSVMNASARDSTILIVAAVFCASPRSSASSAAHCQAPACCEDVLGVLRRCPSPTGRPAACRRRLTRRRGTGRAGSCWPCCSRTTRPRSRTC